MFPHIVNKTPATEQKMYNILGTGEKKSTNIPQWQQVSDGTFKSSESEIRFQQFEKRMDSMEKRMDHFETLTSKLDALLDMLDAQPNGSTHCPSASAAATNRSAMALEPHTDVGGEPASVPFDKPSYLPVNAPVMDNKHAREQ